MEKQVKMAVIGCGFWGMKMLSEYNKLYDKGEITELVACDSNEEVLKQIRKTYNRIKVVSDYKEVLKYGINCAHILAPNDLHYQITAELLENGVNCLTEKPLTQHYSESFSLVKLAKKKKLVFKTGYVWRFTNVLNELKKILNAGYFDKVQFIRFSWHSYTDHMVGTSIVWDQFPHLLNIYSYLFDEVEHKPKVEVFSTAKYRQKHSEIMYVVLKYVNRDIKLIFDAAWLFPIKERNFQIYGIKDGKTKLLLVDMLKQSIQHNEGEKLVLDFEKPNNTLYEEASDFVRTVKEDVVNTKNDAKSALPQLKLIEKLSDYDNK